MKRNKNLVETTLDLGLGPLEARIMDVLWNETGWVRVQDVCDALNRNSSRKLAYSTVKTVLCILTEKRYLKKRMLGRAHEYIARSTRAQVEQAAVAQFIRPIVRGRPSLIAHLVGELAASDVAFMELERLIDERLRGKQ